MTDSLKQLAKHVSKTLAREARPFYAVVDGATRLVSTSGSAAYYGYDDLQKGQSMDDTFAFLTGLEEIPDQTLKINTLETPSGKAAHVHLLRTGEGWGVAFLDATYERAEVQRHQQAENDLRLLSLEREKLMQKLEIANAEIESANRELDHANQLKSRFIGRMSHEFRTPLSSVLGFADLAKEDLGYPDRALSHLKAIERGGNYLLNLVDNLLDQTVVENDKITTHPTSCDLHAIIEELEELFQPMAALKELTFAWWLSPDTPSRLWIDEIRFRQILINLLGNAFKFTRQGSITVSLDWQEESLSVTVEDTGTGIKDSSIGHVFEAFHKSDDEPHDTKGAGLGLYISREIAQLMGGDLEIVSSTPEGTSIRFWINAPAQHSHAPVTQTLDNATILIIDDDVDIQHLLEVFLISAGCSSVVLSDGSDALERLEETPTDMILIDMHLGDKDGILLTHKIKKAGYNGMIIALSASDDEKLRHNATRAGCSDYLLKPVRRAEFIQRLKAVLSSNISND